MGDPARANRIALPQLGQIAISSMLTVSTCMAYPTSAWWEPQRTSQARKRFSDRRSKSDLRSATRLSPTTFFSSGDRVSTPMRRSLPVRRSGSGFLVVIAFFLHKNRPRKYYELRGETVNELFFNDEACLRLLDGPRRREAAGHALGSTRRAGFICTACRECQTQRQIPFLQWIPDRSALAPP
jgi:hypothetical protein